MAKLTMKSNECFQTFYIDGKPFYGRQHDYDIISFLEAIAKAFPNGFEFEYIGVLSQEEMEEWRV